MRSQSSSKQVNRSSSAAFDYQKQALTSQQRQEHSSKAQEIICSFFVANMKNKSPEWVLQQFEDLFISQAGLVHSELRQALYIIVNFNQEEIFRNTLKRCSYILINNWGALRNYHPIQKLVQLFSKVSESESTLSRTKQRLRGWLKNFFESGDYQELNLFITKYNNREKVRWSSRYASYLLASQSVDSKNPREQREAAKVVSTQLKEDFKLDFAMYTARCKAGVSSVTHYQNPTVLGDDVLHLIQKILEKRGNFSYASLANIFIKQIEGLSYSKVKKSFLNYLFFGLDNSQLIGVLKTCFWDYTKLLYETYDEQVSNSNLLLRTCNRLIEYLTTQKQGKPSRLFTLLALQGEYLTLAIFLLKIILVSKNSYIHLEVCIGYLIQYYENESESDCQWLIKFLETLKVTLTVYAENIRYNLVNIQSKQPQAQVRENFSDYRVFSQVKVDRKKVEKPISGKGLTTRRPIR